MKCVKVLIADDSIVYRTQIRAALAELDWIEIVGIASNGAMAISQIEKMPVDLLILDLEMPELDGIGVLKEICQREIACKVLVFSSASRHGAEITLEALRLGASDFIAKPGGADLDSNSAVTLSPSQRIRDALEPKISALFKLGEDFLSGAIEKPSIGKTKYSNQNWNLFEPEVVVIGSSTGGPTVLEKLFSGLGPLLKCPILVAQHMPPVFTTSLAERIEKISGIPTREGVHGESLAQNRIYLAPGNFHMSLTGKRGNTKIHLDQSPLIHFVRPAVDPLFESAAEIFREKCLGIVLTGMGSDGRAGALKIKEKQGTVLIQSERSCVVFGMPGAVMSAGAYDRDLDPEGLISVLREKAVFHQPFIAKKAIGS